MYPKIFLMLFLFVCLHASQNPAEFTYHSFQAKNLILDGFADYESNGLLALTNSTQRSKGHAFYPDSIRFKSSSVPNGTTFSFSTTFVFAIVAEYPPASQHGLAFTIAPKRGFPEAQGGNYLGLLNPTSNGNVTNHVFAVEMDTFLSDEFTDPDDNHAGIDINSLNSTQYHTVGYYGADNRAFTKFNLSSGVAIQVWVDYDATSHITNVTVAPVRVDKPLIPLLSLKYDLTPIFNEFMYVGFSSASGRWTATSHYLLGWSFKINGSAEELDISKLPKVHHKPSGKSRYFPSALPVIFVVLVVATVVGVVLFLWIRTKKKAQVRKIQNRDEVVSLN